MQNATIAKTINKYSINKILKIILFSVFLLASIVFVFYEDSTSIQESKTPLRTKSVQIFSDLNGNPILAMGNCNEDSDCMPTGCSSQVCSNHSVTTTCELGKFPEKETYTCGCQNGKCVWYR